VVSGDLTTGPFGFAARKWSRPVRFRRIVSPAALAVCTVVILVASAASASASKPSLPQPVSAQAGATWLGGQFTAQGYIPSSGDEGTADLSATANGIVALASANVDPATTATALSYMEDNVDAYVTQEGADGPGQLALLILDAHALGVDPTSFGGTDLVSRLLATQQASGRNTGMFGTQKQLHEFQAGVYDQGLALAALAAAGDTHGSAIRSAESWELSQQCADCGWTTFNSASNPCNGSPADFEGPDTNSTSLAIQGLSAEGDLSGSALSKADEFLVHAQDSDGGWGYEPNTTSTPGSTDPDSTALVLQAILAMGYAPNQAPFNRNANPISVLESFQTSSGTDQGAFNFPGVSGPNIIATYQAVPAVAGVMFPFNLFVTTTSLPAGTVNQPYKVKLRASGGTAPYTWSLVKGDGTLPSGLTLHSSTGKITGTPTGAGTSNFVVEVTDAKTTSSPHHDNVGWAFLSITTSTS
jgi:Putative Ig domain/Squalene-hopene cyclase C-terminal domain